jgi:hypothetical protein
LAQYLTLLANQQPNSSCGQPCAGRNFFVRNNRHRSDVLRGRIPANAQCGQFHDIYKGAGLAPWVYGLAATRTTGTGTTPEPSSILLFGSGILGLDGVWRGRMF